MNDDRVTTAQIVALFDAELADLGFTEDRRTLLLVEALRHELPAEGLILDGSHLQAPADE